MLDLRSVSFAYRQRSFAIESLSTEFAAGELVAIAGPNGSGKSTLLRLLARVLTPRGGEIFLREREIRQWDPRAYARTVGYLPQEVESSFPLRALEVVLSGRGPYLSRFQWENAADVSRAQEALRECDGLHLAERFLDEMSGGERKRVFLARVLAGDPEVILLDEPFAALDLSHIQQLLGLLRRLVRRTGRTVIYVSHELNWSGAYADRMLVLSGGSIVADGPPAEVLTPELLLRVFEVQAQSVPIPGQRRVWIVPRP